MTTQNIEATVNVNDVELFYEIDGAGEPLLLLHGGTGCHGDWVYAGGEQLVRQYKLIAPDARGHGRSTNPLKTITHRQCALDTLALLEHLDITRYKAIGVSMGGNILLHMATLQPERIEAMVVVSATMNFPEQARRIMAAVPAPDNQPASEWEAMRKRHHRGDEQIRALWEWTHSLKDSHGDMNFTPADLSAIHARTLIVYGDRDPLYPVEMAVEMYRAIPNSALWIVPNGGHGPVFLDAAPQFVQTALAFFESGVPRRDLCRLQRRVADASPSIIPPVLRCKILRWYTFSHRSGSLSRPGQRRELTDCGSLLLFFNGLGPQTLSHSRQAAARRVNNLGCNPQAAAHFRRPPCIANSPSSHRCQSFSASTTIASAGVFTAVISYGDSLSDNGNLYALTGQPPSPPYYMGRFSNGPVTTEQLATSLGSPLLDYAYGGATTGTGPVVGPLGIGMLNQVAYSLTLGPVKSALPGSLVVVWGGPNDFADFGLSTATADAAVANLVTEVGELRAAGARHILVPGMPDLGLTPEYMAFGPVVAGEASFLSAYFNSKLLTDLPSGVAYYDTFGFMHTIVADPSAYGFTNVTMPCLVGATPCALATQSQYLFWDSIHPTTTADGFLAAQFEKAVVPEPSTFLMLGTRIAGLVGVLRKRMSA